MRTVAGRLRGAVVATVAAAAVAGAAPAFAAWQSTGSGSATAQAGTWDTVAPVVTINSVSKTLLNASDTTATIVWHAGENGTYSVRNAASTCSNGTQVTGTLVSGTYATQPSTVSSAVNASALSEGTNTIRVCVTDATFNAGSATVTITKDTVAPPASSVSATTPANNRVQLTFSNTEAGVVFQCNSDADTTGWRSCTSPFLFQNGNTYDGTHLYSVRAIDVAGNIGPTSSVSQAA